MSDLIRREDVQAMIVLACKSHDRSDVIMAIRRGVKNIPSVDAVPVVHARPVWINPLDPGAKICTWKCSSLCSACGDYVAVSWKYCQNCGAKMDGGTEL
jgi:hypothetical protein